MRPRGLIWPLALLLGAVAARRWTDVVEVRGRSMLPTLLPGDRLLVARLRASADRPTSSSPPIHARRAAR